MNILFIIFYLNIILNIIQIIFITVIIIINYFWK